MNSLADRAEWQRRRRFLVNGVFATAVHFFLLVIGLEVLGLESVGAANVLAAGGGIAASFVGNRWFVFGPGEQRLSGQAARFLALYAAIALAHGLVLWTWSDLGGQDYRLGFLIATVGQIALSYLGNKRLVFK